MKRTICFLLLLGSFCNSLHAQSVFYALTPANGAGVISRYNAATNNLTIAHAFENPGTNPFNSEFVEGADGKLYSTTAFGGAFNKGVIFSLDPVTNAETKLLDLNSTCTGILTTAAGSLMYGMTADYIFSFNTSTSSFAVLYNFTAAQRSPLDALTAGSDGKYYGTTGSIIFSFNPATNTYTQLYQLDESRGHFTSGLTFGTNNKLYGTTIGGDFNYNGLLFSFDPASSVFSELHSFITSTGEFPLKRMTLANNGKLYGVTTGGLHLGVIFSYDPNTNLYASLHDFENGEGGRGSKTLAPGSDGKLYGTSYSVDYDDGIIYSFDPSTNIYTKLHDIAASGNFFTSEMPVGKLLQASNGKFYGMLGNEYEANGKIFSYDKNTDVFSNLLAFTIPGGFKPNSNLLQGDNDLFYGTTTAGGSNNNGVLFSFNPTTNAYTKLHEFDGTNGKIPSGALVKASNGKFYGKTLQGGATDKGVIFSFRPSDNTFEKVYDLNDLNSGGDLVQADNGKLYGTSYVGSSTVRSIFSFDPLTNVYTRVYDFSNVHPNSSLVKAPDGKLYGMGLGGAYGNGALFSYDPVLNVFNVLYSFDNTNGRWPYGDLLLSSNGLFYGMASQGGANSQGVIFSFNPSTASIIKLFDFGGANGEQPMGNLAQDNDGKLYGMTSQGGSNNFGVLFSYNIQTNSFSKLQDFDGLNGGNSQFGGLARLVSTAPVSKFVKVNVYGGTNPYNNAEWNNWNTFSSLSSGTLTYSDGSSSSISSVLSQQTSVSDNGASYTATMAPQEVIRYASYSTSNRTLTLNGLDNSKTYDLELYASRNGASTNTTRFTAASVSVDIATANNSSNKASFTALVPTSGRIILNVDRLNTYNYINGFILSETGSGGANPAPVVNAGTDESITVPVNSVQLNGSASDANGFIFSYSWTKISGPTSFSFDNTAVNNPVISNLVEGSYTFRLTAFDNQGASSFDDVMIVVHPTVVPARLVKVNIYGGINPYNHPEWNNWNTNASLSSGNLKYSDGIVSSINAVLSQQSGISDNGTPYNVSMCPLEVGRYASYSSANRTLVISGLNNTRTYNIEIYASRKGVSNNSSRFAIAASSTDIATDNNLINKAVFISLTPVGGQIILNISRLNTYNYINGFVVTENAAAATLTASRVVAEKELSPASVGIFPNPVLENVTVEINNQQRGQMKVQIVDMSGKVLKQFIVNKTHSGIEAFSFSVNDLSQGTYIIRMQIEKWTENKKMVKY